HQRSPRHVDDGAAVAELDGAARDAGGDGAVGEEHRCLERLADGEAAGGGGVEPGPCRAHATIGAYARRVEAERSHRQARRDAIEGGARQDLATAFASRAVAEESRGPATAVDNR